jgi:hypothetical protein
VSQAVRRESGGVRRLSVFTRRRIDMPQRPSGRHVGVSYERLPDWAESAPWGKLSEIVLSLHTVEDFLLILDLLEYADSDRPPSPLNPAAGKPFLSPVRISELNTPACPWAGEDQTALLEWLHAQHLQRMFDHAAADLHAILRSRPAPEALRGLFDGEG